jgi:hypothetical protein
MIIGGMRAMGRPDDLPFKRHRAAMEAPSHTVHERLADVLVHAPGVLAAGVGGACLIALKGASLPATPRKTFGVSITR